MPLLGLPFANPRIGDPGHISRSRKAKEYQSPIADQGWRIAAEAVYIKDVTRGRA